MADINSVRQQMMEELENRIKADGKLSTIRKKIQNGGTYSDAEAYAIRSGELLSTVLQENLTDDLFDEGMNVSDLASAIIPMMEKNYDYVSAASAVVQKALNEAGGLGISPIRAEFDQRAAYNLIGKMAKYDSLEDASWLLDEPVVTNFLEVVDRTTEANLDFQYKAGMQPKIIRTAEPDCCDTCAALEGEYDYEEVRDRNNPVFWRHNNCQCEITYLPGVGRAQDVRSKNWIDNSERDRRIDRYRREEKRSMSSSQQSRDFRVNSGGNVGGNSGNGNGDGNNRRPNGTIIKTPGQREIEASIKEQINYSGKENLIAKTIVKNHRDLKYISPERMYNLLEEAGFKSIPLAKSGHGFNDLSLSEGGGYIVSLGNDGGTIEYHPEGGRHGINYYRVSSGQTRKHWYDTDGKEFIIGRGGKPQYIDL
mgnify:CR=1 FL=1